jgi:outer membrane protein assembly factor BamD (BamD/ComL family)
MKHFTLSFSIVLVTASAYATGGGWFETPAKLSDTLDMLPGKSLGEIFLETSTIPTVTGEANFSDAAKDAAGRLGKDSLANLLKEADEWIAQARAHRDNAACNLAHDLHDAIAVSDGNPEAARDYILWRLDHPLGDSSAEEKAEAAKGPIKANWFYAAGAALFTIGDRTKCQKWFDRVIDDFPKSPRAEIATFMNARCLFSAARGDAADANARKAAITAFEVFRKRYPRGPFDADALGWLGALACDDQNYLKALDYYIAQAETPGHPETLPSAIYNCEKALAHVGAKPGGDAAFALIARHPRIAMAFTYLVLSAPEADNYDGKWDNPAEVRKWRRTMLPRIAAAVAKQKDSYKSGDWQPRYLAMLVQAASASGNQAQALQLSQIAPDQLKRSDDLLFARAVALQRANKSNEAIETFKTFLQTFPKSPMQPGVRLRLALALQDNHQAGEAIVVLCDLLPKAESEATPSPVPDAAEKDGDVDEDKSETAEEPGVPGDTLGSRFTDGEVYPASETDWKMTESSVYPNLSGADEDQIQQFIDTLANFAPLPELVTTLSNPKFDQASKTDLRAILAERYLVAENFAEAKHYLTNSATLKTVERLEQLTKENAESPQQKAERMVQLGDVWAQLRGQLLRAPLDTKTHFYTLPRSCDGLTRRGNGLALHQANVEDQLDDRDELHHAARWWMRAARLVPGTPMAAQARLQALEALPKMARASEYAETRAKEIKLEAVSREIYGKLRSESPKSPEAQRLAAYWSVPVVAEQTSDESETSGGFITYSWPNGCKDEAASRGYPFSDDDAFQRLVKFSDERNYQRTEAPEGTTSRVAKLRQSASTLDPPDLLNEVKALAEELRNSAIGPEDAGGINCMDDLAQFLAEPGATREAQQIYINLRLDILHRARAALPDPGIDGKDDDESVSRKIDAAQKNPAFKDLGDYLDFCRIALVAGARFDVATDNQDPKDPEHPLTYISRDHAVMEKMARAFLQKYPHSHKKEAATFVVARAVYSLSCPFIECIGLILPGTDPLEGEADVAQKPHAREPFSPERVMQALDNYDREFPKGRYAADVQNLRAATFWRMGQWDKALRMTLTQIADEKHGDIQSEAAIRLANLFAELANAQHRAGVLEAIRAQPAAIPFLQAYTGAASKSRNHPLRYLQRYLSDQLHFKIPEPEKEDLAQR